MAIYRLGDKVPQVDSTAWVMTEATLIGEVVLEAQVSIWAYAVARGDNEPIRIREGSNVQEGAVLHVDPGFPLAVGRAVTVGHQAMLHGCTVGDGTLIGIHAVVLNGAVIGRGCLVGAGAVVTEGQQFPDNSLILGAPARRIRELTDEQQAALRQTSSRYRERAAYYAQHLQRLA